MWVYIEQHNLPNSVIPLLLDCHISFDAIHIKQDIIYLKNTGQLIGLATDMLDLRKPIFQQLDSSGFLVVMRSNAFGSFWFPLAIIGMSSESNENVQNGLLPIIKDFVNYVHKKQGKVHFAVCDGSSAHNDVCILCFPLFYYCP